MNLCLFKKTVQIVSTLVVVNVLIFVPVYAQSEIAATANAAEGAAKTPQLLLSDLEQRERAMYELFNGLNSSDQSDIICSAIPTEDTDENRQLCEPVFLEEIRREVDEEIANSSKTEAGFFARIRNAFQSPEERTEKLFLEKASVPIGLLQQEIESLARVHPNLLAQLQSIGELQHEYLQSIEVERRRTSYLMRQNEPSYNQGFRNDNRAVGGKPWFSAPPAGHTTPQIHFGYPDLTNK